MLDIAKWLWGPSLILTKRKLYIEINIGNREIYYLIISI